MSTVPTTVNYSGRQVDVELLQSVVNPGAEQRVRITSVGTTPHIVTGVEKAVQRYATLLLTTLGEVHFDATAGSKLVSLLMRGNVGNTGYLGHLFGMANSSAIRALAADDQDIRFGVTPDDERVVGAVLQDINVDYVTGTVNLSVLLILAAGTTFSFVVPISTAR